MEKQLQGSLTRGPIFKVLMALALPIMASAFLSTAYSIVDMFWIGKMGSAAVAGVGIGGQFVWFSSGIATLAKMGGQIHVGQALGAGDRDRAVRYGKAALQMILLFGIVYGLIFALFASQLVGIFHLTDPQTIAYANVYCRISCGLILFSFINTVLIGLYTAQGDSKTPLKANVIGLLLNIVLDPIMIFGLGPFPEWKVVGAAVATVISQAVATGILVGSIYSKKRQENILREVRIFSKPEKTYLSNVLKMGWPNAIQSLFYCGISMVLTRVIAGFGDVAVAAARLCEQLEALTWNVSDGFSGAINAFVAQNFGAKMMDRVKKGYGAAFILSVVWGIFITALFLMYPQEIIGLFFAKPEEISVAVGYLTIVGLSQAFMSVELMAVGAISGLGSTKVCSGISVFFTVLRVPLALVLSQTSLGLLGVWWTLTLTSVAKGVCLHFAFVWQRKKKNRELELS